MSQFQGGSSDFFQDALNKTQSLNTLIDSLTSLSNVLQQVRDNTLITGVSLFDIVLPVNFVDYIVSSVALLQNSLQKSAPASVDLLNDPIGTCHISLTGSTPTSVYTSYNRSQYESRMARVAQVIWLGKRQRQASFDLENSALSQNYKNSKVAVEEIPYNYNYFDRTYATSTPICLTPDGPSPYHRPLSYTSLDDTYQNEQPRWRYDEEHVSRDLGKSPLLQPNLTPAGTNLYPPSAFTLADLEKRYLNSATVHHPRPVKSQNSFEVLHWPYS